ncbi:MAG: DUF1266 domain-containing protein [Treponema sp.]|nr:DUF1266 domain-containing protein [Treponema sp.]
MSRIILLFMAISLFLTSCSNREEIPESVFWINGTHAVLTKANGADINRFGTLARNSTNRTRVRNTLDSSWGITTKEDLDYMIDSLVIGRHNQQFLEEAEEYGITRMNREQFETELSNVDSREAIMYFQNMYNAYHGFRDKAIMGWDLSRATQLCAFGYIAEFYTYDEAVDKALAIGRIIQSTFTTWDTFYTSYFFGYAYWSEDDLEDPNSNYSQRVRIFYNLKEDPKSPLNLAWNLELIRE